MEEKGLRDEIQRNAFKNQQQKIKQTEQFITRFRSKATKSRQVQSRVKMLEKMDVVDEVQDEVVDLNIRFTFRQQPGKIIASFNDVYKAYGDKKIFENTTFAIERGDKIALIGANGKGKSTLLRMVANSEQFEGEYQPGYNVIPAFYAQHQLESLHIENEILEELKQAGSGKMESELRNILGCFLFQGDEVFKKIKVLSGGEKSRVALAKTLISEANFLLLDEPTNHLDMQSVNILIQALQAYEGSFLVVSHDRHFISHVANKIWYIENYELKEYPGTYDEFTIWYERKLQAEKDQEMQAKAAPAPKPEKKTRQPLNNEQERELKKLQKELTLIEEKITALEAEQQTHEEQMAKKEVFADPHRLAEATQAYERTKTALAEQNAAWETLAEKIETLEQ